MTKIWDRGVARGELVLIADLGDHPYRPLAPLRRVASTVSKSSTYKQNSLPRSWHTQVLKQVSNRWHNWHTWHS